MCVKTLKKSELSQYLCKGAVCKFVAKSGSAITFKSVVCPPSQSGGCLVAGFRKYIYYKKLPWQAMITCEHTMKNMHNVPCLHQEELLAKLS